jgi:autoinducer 2 (AI-2) kinase
MSYLLALDAGTGSGRAVIFDEDGRQLAVAQREWQHHSDPTIPGSMNFDVEANWQLLATCVREAVAKAGIAVDAIRAVSASSMREGIVLYDAHGRELWACANVDARAADQVRQLKALSADLERRVYEQSGQTFALGALPRLLWVKDHLPGVYERTAAVEMISDWVLTRLSGVLASEPSNGCTTGIYSLAARNWAPELATACGLRSDIYPRVVEPGTVTGAVTAEASAVTGLRIGTPVVMGGGDVQLGAVGVGSVEYGQTVVVGGTFWQQMVNLDTGKTDPHMRIRVNCHAIPDAWQAEAIAFFPGMAVRWFRDALCHAEKEAAIRDGGDPYDVLTQMAAHVPPGSHGILPIFSDLMNYAEWRHAAPSFVNLGLDPDKYNKGAMFRSLLENAAMLTAGNLAVIRDFTGIQSDSVIFAGGAAKSALWCQILADVLGRAVQVPVVKEASALGVAICAGVGAGTYDDMQTAARQLVRWERTFEPDMTTTAHYQEIYERWRQAYAAQLDLAKRRVTTPMWEAPGL